MLSNLFYYVQASAKLVIDPGQMGNIRPINLKLFIEHLGNQSVIIMISDYSLDYPTKWLVAKPYLSIIVSQQS